MSTRTETLSAVSPALDEWIVRKDESRSLRSVAELARPDDGRVSPGDAVEATGLAVGSAGRHEVADQRPSE